MSLPTSILQHIYNHYQAAEWGIITLNQDNQIIQINPKAKQDLQLSDEQKDIQEVLPLLATESLDQPFTIPFYNHGELVFDVHFLLHESQKYLILLPIDKIHQQVQYKQQLAHEQSIERLRLQHLFTALDDAHAELKEANSSKSFYISALSHEMGNPLNAIKGYNELLAEGSIDIQQAAQIIDKNVDKLQQIINQTLDYDQQKTIQKNQRFEPAAFINDLFKDFKIQAHNKGLQLLNEVDPNILLASNQTKWVQIFTNLISNAIKYTESGHILIKSQTEDDILHIDVIDTGCGMSAAFQKQLFTAWSREGKSTSGGNGIGLVISKMLAEQLGGELILHSSNAQGSQFRFSYPYQSPKPGRRILLVDDDLDCLSLFAFYLSHAGHQVDTADSVQQMMYQVKNQPYDVLITDLNLGDGLATDVYESIKPFIKKVLVMTANPNQELLDSLKATGFDQVLCKPLSQQQLVNSVA